MRFGGSTAGYGMLQSMGLIGDDLGTDSTTDDSGLPPGTVVGSQTNPDGSVTLTYSDGTTSTTGGGDLASTAATTGTEDVTYGALSSGAPLVEPDLPAGTSVSFGAGGAPVNPTQVLPPPPPPLPGLSNQVLPSPSPAPLPKPPPPLPPAVIPKGGIIGWISDHKLLTAGIVVLLGVGAWRAFAEDK